MSEVCDLVYISYGLLATNPLSRFLSNVENHHSASRCQLVETLSTLAMDHLSSHKLTTASRTASAIRAHCRSSN